LIKEVAYYRQEVIENEAKLQKMKDDQKDHYDIKMFNEVLLESKMMVKESPTRLQKALEDLSLYIDMNQFDDDCEWSTTARNILAQQSLGEGEVVETGIDNIAEGEAF
jgi:hypothetical protein